MEKNKTGPDISKDDCMCPICMDIMIQPVTMPCQHSLCMPCYQLTVQKSNLVCPICRLRISTWARKASRSNTLVDKTKWEAIQTAYPKKVKNRFQRLSTNESCRDEDDDESEEESYETQLRKLKELSRPGEIREEYELALKKLQRQREEEAKKEEEASAALIRALQDQEEKELVALERRKEEMEQVSLEVALQLHKDTNTLGQRNSRTGSDSSSTPSLSLKTKNKSKKGASNKPANRPASVRPNITLNTFFSPVARNAKSTPPCSRDPIPGGQKPAMSPYPYPCISPKDKIFYGLSALSPTNKDDSDSCSSTEIPFQLEHSYSTASAKRIDLTSPNADEMARPRSDLEAYDISKVKSEPEDIFGPGPSGLCGSQVQTSRAPSSFRAGPIVIPESPGVQHNKVGPSASSTSNNHSFRPILSFPRTPPKQPLPGHIADISPWKVKLNWNMSSRDQNSHTLTSKMKSSTGIGKKSTALKSNLTISPSVQLKSPRVAISCLSSPENYLNTIGTTSTVSSSVQSKNLAAQTVNNQAVSSFSSVSSKTSPVVVIHVNSSPTPVTLVTSDPSECRNNDSHKESKNLRGDEIGHQDKSTSDSKVMKCTTAEERTAVSSEASQSQPKLVRKITRTVPASSSSRVYSDDHNNCSDATLECEEIFLKEKDNTEEEEPDLVILEPNDESSKRYRSNGSPVTKTSRQSDKEIQSNPSVMITPLKYSGEENMGAVLQAEPSKFRTDKPLKDCKNVYKSKKDVFENGAVIETTLGLRKGKLIAEVSKSRQKTLVKNLKTTHSESDKRNKKGGLKRTNDRNASCDVIQVGECDNSNSSMETIADNNNSLSKPGQTWPESPRKKKKLHNVSGSQDDLYATYGIDTTGMTQEEKDHALAIKMQEIFSDLDRLNANVDRFKGSRNQYSFREKRRR